MDTLYSPLIVVNLLKAIEYMGGILSFSGLLEVIIWSMNNAATVHLHHCRQQMQVHFQVSAACVYLTSLVVGIQRGDSQNILHMLLGHYELLYYF